MPFLEAISDPIEAFSIQLLEGPLILFKAVTFKILLAPSPQKRRFSDQLTALKLFPKDS